MTDGPGLVIDPGWTPAHLWSSLDFIEDNCIRDLKGVSLLTALRSERFERAYYAAHMLLTIARIRRSRKAKNLDEALCGAIELGEMLSEECAHSDVRWRLGTDRLKVRGNSALATWGSPEARRARKEDVLGLFCEAMNSGAVTQEQAYDIVGRNVGKSSRTVRRIVTGN
jgi:hypothetical protein